VVRELVGAEPSGTRGGYRLTKPVMTPAYRHCPGHPGSADRRLETAKALLQAASVIGRSTGAALDGGAPRRRLRRGWKELIGRLLRGNLSGTRPPSATRSPRRSHTARSSASSGQPPMPPPRGR
jgi:hypothetical protein